MPLPHNFKRRPKMLKNIYIILALLFVIMGVSLNSKAQTTIIVKGKVTDKAGQPLPGVTVTEKSKEGRIVNGVATNESGDYQIKIQNTADSLRFSQIGMRAVTRSLKGAQIINVKLLDDGSELASVEIKAQPRTNSGGFLNIDDKDRTAAIKTINMKEYEDVPVTSVDQLLEGKAAGLLISMNSADPGAGSSIQIRGAVSLGLGSQPLIVVDDIPFKTPLGADLNSTEGISALVNISPADIAQIDILKDAAATALYGSDGANGVINIRTKRGSNAHPTVTISTNTTVKVPQSPLPMLNGDQYKTMMLESYQNRYGTNIDITQLDIRFLFLEKGSLDYENYNNNTNWQNAINERGLTQVYNAQIIGGGESARYNISLGYTNDQGPVINTGLNRLNARFNFDYKIANNLQFQSDFAYSDQLKTQAYAVNTDINNSVGYLALRKAPVLPIYTQDQFGNDLTTFYNPISGAYQSGLMNPLALADNSLNRIRENRLESSVVLRYSPIKGMQINTTVANSYLGSQQDKFLPLSASGVDFYRLNNFNLIVGSTDNTGQYVPLNYSKIFIKTDFVYDFTRGLGLDNKHQLQMGVYPRYTGETQKTLTFDGTETPSDLITSPFATSVNNKIKTVDYVKRDIAITAQTYYIYDERYSLSASLSRQGSSYFGSNNRWGNFPAFSGFWRPTSEHFFRDHEDRFKWLESLKFRGSWGITGRSPNEATSRLTSLTFQASSPFADIQGVTPQNLELTNLRWEKTTSVNLGIDLNLFKGRLSVTTDFSKNKTVDLIQTLQVPTSSGYNTIVANSGSLSSNVWEFEMTGVPVKTKNWTVTASFNVTTSQTKVLELPGHQPLIQNNNFDNGQFISIVNEGDPIGTFYGLKYLGVYSRNEDAFVKDANGKFITDYNGNKTPVRWLSPSGDAFVGGDAHYADLNNDGVINQQDITAIGNANPKYYGGAQLRVKYKAWELFTVFTFKQGFDIENLSKMFTTSMYDTYNQSTIVLNRWRKQGDITDVPRADYGAGHNFVGSDRYIEDGSYFKCSQLIISYDTPLAFCKRLGIKRLKASATISNPFIITKYSGIDPSVGLSTNNVYSFNIDKALTPNPITYNLGLIVSF